MWKAHAVHWGQLDLQERLEAAVQESVGACPHWGALELPPGHMHHLGVETLAVAAPPVKPPLGSSIPMALELQPAHSSAKAMSFGDESVETAMPVVEA